jgi:hypothetical protein
MGTPIHHLEVICLGCEVRLKLNDLPLMRLVAPGPDAEWYAPPINPYLVGEGNVVELEVRPLLDADGNPIDLGRARIELGVRKFEKGDAVAPGTGTPVLDVNVHEELQQRIAEAKERDEELEMPQSFFHVFDNEGPSFSAELMESEPFTDENALRDYAIRLRDLAAARDADALLAEMEPKIQAYMVAYEEPRELFVESLGTGLRTEFLQANVITDFAKGDVELESCCGGRIWHLKRPGGAPLLQTAPDDAGNTMQFEIYAGPRDGAPRVVR